MLKDVYFKAGKQQFPIPGTMKCLNKSGSLVVWGVNCVLDGVTAKSFNKYLLDINHVPDIVTFSPKQCISRRKLALSTARKEKKSGKT